MNSFGLTAGAFFIAAGAYLAPAHAAEPASPERDVAVAIHARIDAFNRRDIAAFAGAASDDYQGVGDDGANQEGVPDYSHLPREYSQISDLRDMHIRVHGDTAVANYRTTEREPLGGAVIVTEERRSEAWQKQAGRWRLLQAHLAPILVNVREPVKTAPAHLADYPGSYEVRPDTIAMVTARDEHLYMAFTGEGDPWQASYGGGDEFFFRQPEGDPVTYVFERNAQGRVIALQMRRPDGQTIRAPRKGV